LPLTVETVEQTCQLLRPLRIIGEEELNTEIGILQSTGGIKPGGETESNIAAGDLANAGNSTEGLQTGAPALIDDAETDAGQDAIDAAQRNDVSNRPQRNEIETVAEIGLGLCREGANGTEAAAQGDEEHKGDADAGKIFIRIERIEEMRINDGAGRGEDGGRLMMISNDQVEAKFTGDFGLDHRGDAAIDGDGHGGAGGDRLTQMFGREAVTITQAQRDKVIDFGAKSPQPFDEESRTADAIDIIITVNSDLFPCPYGSDKARYRSLHLAEEKGVGEILQTRIEKIPGSRQISATALGKEVRGQMIDMQIAN
jgi:hypothetical protein